MSDCRHPSGNAIDVFGDLEHAIDNWDAADGDPNSVFGDQVVALTIDNWEALDVARIIWRGAVIASPHGPWRPVDDPTVPPWHLRVVLHP